MESTDERDVQLNMFPHVDPGEGDATEIWIVNGSHAQCCGISCWGNSSAIFWADVQRREAAFAWHPSQEDTVHLVQCIYLDLDEI